MIHSPESIKLTICDQDENPSNVRWLPISIHLSLKYRTLPFLSSSARECSPSSSFYRLVSTEGLPSEESRQFNHLKLNDNVYE